MGEEKSPKNTNKLWVLVLSLIITVILSLLLLAVLFLWKPWERNGQDIKVSTTEYNNPIVYVSGDDALYLCDGDGSNQACLSDKPYRNDGRVNFFQYARCCISEDKRFVVYPIDYSYSNYLKREVYQLGVYDRLEEDFYRIASMTTDYRITDENYILIQSLVDNRIEWVDLHRIDTYKHIEDDYEFEGVSVLPESIDYLPKNKVNYSFNSHQSFFITDEQSLVIAGYPVKDSTDDDCGGHFGGEVFEENRQIVITKVDLSSKSVSLVYEDIATLYADNHKKEIYFMKDYELYHLNSQLEVVDKKQGIVYFYWDETFNYLMYLRQPKPEESTIKGAELLEKLGSEEDKLLESFDVLTYRTCDLVIEYQNEETMYPSLGIYTNKLSDLLMYLPRNVPNRGMYLSTKKDIIEKMSKEEYEERGFGSSGRLALDNQYLLGTRLYKNNDIMPYDIVDYEEETSQVTIIQSILNLKPGSAIYQAIQSDGMEEKEKVVYTTDMNTGKIIDYWVNSLDDVRYYGKMGKNYLMYNANRGNYEDLFNVNLYYGIEQVGERVLHRSIHVIDNKECIYLAGYQASVDSLDLYTCDADGKATLIDDNVFDLYVTGNEVVYYCKGSGTSDSKLYSYINGSSRCLELNAKAFIPLDE